LTRERAIVRAARDAQVIGPRNSLRQVGVGP